MWYLSSTQQRDMTYRSPPSASPRAPLRHIAARAVIAAILLAGGAACDTNGGPDEPPLEPGTFRATVEPGPQLDGEARYQRRADTTTGAQDTLFALRLQAGTATLPSPDGGLADSTIATGIFIQLPQSAALVPGAYPLEQEGPFFAGPNQFVVSAAASGLTFPLIYGIEEGTLTVTRIDGAQVYGEIDASGRTLPSGLGSTTAKVTGRFAALPEAAR